MKFNTSELTIMETDNGQWTLIHAKTQTLYFKVWHTKEEATAFLNWAKQPKDLVDRITP